MTRLGSRAALVFKQFPGSFHAHAASAAAASLCAHAQLRFWALYDALLAHASALDDDAIRRYAAAAGLDLGRFDGCRVAPATLAKVAADADEGRAAGVHGAPTLFINGRLVTLRSDYDADTLVDIVDQVLAAKR